MFLSNFTHAQQPVRFTSVATGLRLDGNMQGEIYPHSPHDGSWQKWFLYLAGEDGKGRYFYIKNLETGRYLGQTIIGSNDVTGYEKNILQNETTKKFVQWYIQEEGHGIVTISHRITNFCLDGNNTDIYPLAPNTGPYQRWRMTPWRPDEGIAKECKLFFWWCN